MKNNQLTKLVDNYYTDLYKNSLSLKDYKWRVKQRMLEDKETSHYTSSHALTVISNTLNLSFKNKKVLVVGAGTGVEMIRLKNLGAEVFALEPEESAFKILNLKAQKNQIPKDKIIKGVAEKIPFSKNKFDFVYCYTVLEHVQNVKKSIEEMIRVTKTGGNVFIVCPDYRFIWEPHYKTYLPIFFPRWILKLILIMKGRNPHFFGTLQLVNAKQLKNIFRNYSNIIPVQFFIKKKFNPVADFWQKVFEIEPNQFWILKKT